HQLCANVRSGARLEDLFEFGWRRPGRLARRALAGATALVLDTDRSRRFRLGDASLQYLASAVAVKRFPVSPDLWRVREPTLQLLVGQWRHARSRCKYVTRNRRGRIALAVEHRHHRLTGAYGGEQFLDVVPPGLGEGAGGCTHRLLVIGG